MVACVSQSVKYSKFEGFQIWKVAVNHGQKRMGITSNWRLGVKANSTLL
jgi:hypothetical protein